MTPIAGQGLCDMPIYADPSNYRLGSAIPHCDGEIITLIEGLGGCDYIVSPLADYPPTKRAHIQDHLDEGAVLIALKVGKTGDLIGSIGDRLRGHLVKMLSFECHPCQRALLTTGYNLELNGEIYIGEQGTSAATVFGMAAKTLLKHGGVGNYKGLNTSLLRWVLSGGVIYPTVPRLSDLPTALAVIEREVIETHKDPSRYHFETLTKVADQPNPDKQSLQVLVAVPPGVNILAQQPGIGKDRALAYYEFYEGKLMIAIESLCDVDGYWPEFDDPKLNRALCWGPTRAKTLALAWGLEQKEIA